MKDRVATASFAMTSEPEKLSEMRAWLWGLLVAEGLPLHDCAALLLAVGELCTNSIKHAYGGAPGQPIRVTFEAFEDRLVIEVEDFGTPFDDERYVAPDLDTAPERGLGLFVVRRIADAVSRDASRTRGTRWTLSKYRPGYGPVAVT